MNKIAIIVTTVFTMLLSGCSARIGDLTVGSSKNINLNNKSLVKGERVSGSDICPVVLLPLVIPNFKNAMDEAIEKNACAVGLTDVVIKQFHYAFLLGVTGYKVEGNLLIDTSKPGCGGKIKSIDLFDIQQNETIKQSFDAYQKALKESNVTAIANMLHPEALQQFHDVISSILHGKSSASAAKVFFPILSVNTINDYDKLTAKEVYIRMTSTAFAKPKAMQLIKNSQSTFINSTIKNDTAELTYSFTININGKKISGNAQETLKLDNGKWLYLLPINSKKAIDKFKQQFPA